MIAFLIKTSLILIIVLGFYKMLIEKESFFSTNRLYLVLGLLLAFSIPFISLPKLINNQGIVSDLIELSPVQDLDNKEVKFKNETDGLSNVNRSVSTVQPTTNTVATTESSRSFLDWLFIAYLFGVIVLTINLLAQIGNLVFKIIRSKDKIIEE